ncbi:MAG TPA: PEP-CTERM sorting domain-containing protein, partial [Phycisphaerae bacterium]|nr:PEP-CTERM sorting domain-containing protein [Phycisphaerae bacterium]
VGINGSTALSNLFVSGHGTSVYHSSGDVTISGALTVGSAEAVGDWGYYDILSGASLSAGEIHVHNTGSFFSLYEGGSVHAGLFQVGREDWEKRFVRQRVQHNVGTPNPNLPGWLIGGDGKGGDGQMTCRFGALPAIGPVVFEHGRSYSMKEVALAINAASQASLRYDAARIVYDSDSNEYFLRVEARKPGVEAWWGPYGGNPLTQQGMTAGNWNEYAGVVGSAGMLGDCDVSGALEVERLHVLGGALYLSDLTTVTVTGELLFSYGANLVPWRATELRMIGADLRNTALELASYWNRVTMRFLPSGKTARVEVDSIDVGADLGVWEPIAPKSMILGALHVGSAIELVDEYGNQLHGGVEALYVHDLVMEPGGWIGGGLNLYYLNGGEPKQFFRGDANLDGKVGLIDLTILADGYGLRGDVDWARGDFNGDGVVGIADLVVLADNYGAATQPAGAAAVPEPSALAVLTAGCIAAFLARKHRRRRG